MQDAHVMNLADETRQRDDGLAVAAPGVHQLHQVGGRDAAGGDEGFVQDAAGAPLTGRKGLRRIDPHLFQQQGGLETVSGAAGTEDVLDGIPGALEVVALEKDGSAVKLPGLDIGGARAVQDPGAEFIQETVGGVHGIRDGAAGPDEPGIALDPPGLIGGLRAFDAPGPGHAAEIPGQQHGRFFQFGAHARDETQQQVAGGFKQQLDHGQDVEDGGDQAAVMLAEEAPHAAVEFHLAAHIDLLGAEALVVDHADLRQVPDLEAAFGCAFAEVGLLQVEEEPFVQPADAFDQRFADQHAGPDHRGHLDRFAEARTFAGIGLGEHDLQERLVEELGCKPGDDVHRILQTVIGIGELHPADAGGRVGVHEGAHGADGVMFEDRVRIEQQQHVAVGRRNAAVDGPGKTQVAAVFNDLEVGRTHDVQGIAPVVDQDDLMGAVGVAPQRCQAFHQGLVRAHRDDDDADLLHVSFIISFDAGCPADLGLGFQCCGSASGAAIFLLKSRKHRKKLPKRRSGSIMARIMIFLQMPDNYWRFQ